MLESNVLEGTWILIFQQHKCSIRNTQTRILKKYCKACSQCGSWIARKITGSRPRGVWHLPRQLGAHQAPHKACMPQGRVSCDREPHVGSAPRHTARPRHQQPVGRVRRENAPDHEDERFSRWDVLLNKLCQRVAGGAAQQDAGRARGDRDLHARMRGTREALSTCSLSPHAYAPPKGRFPAHRDGLAGRKRGQHGLVGPCGGRKGPVRRNVELEDRIQQLRVARQSGLSQAQACAAASAEVPQS